jgi:hypothetical protein
MRKLYGCKQSLFNPVPIGIHVFSTYDKNQCFGESALTLNDLALFVSDVPVTTKLEERKIFYTDPEDR